MEIILDTLLIFACLASIVTNFVYLWSVSKLNRAADKTLKEIPQILVNVDSNTNKILDYCFHLEDRVNSIDQKTPSLALQQPQSPIKPNNWDSMREAFKGPTRVEINE